VYIIPIFAASKNRLKDVVLSSLVYALPVLVGIGLYAAQLLIIQNSYDRIKGIIKFRTFSAYGNEGNITRIVRNFVTNFSGVGILAVVIVFIFTILIIKSRWILKNHAPFIKLCVIIFIPPCMQIFVLQNHSGIHEFSMLKFSLPVVLSFPIFVFVVLEYTRKLDMNIVLKTENKNAHGRASIPVFYGLIIVFSVVVMSLMSQNKYYLEYRIDRPISYELPKLIRENYRFDDVYFSFTESIAGNPPMDLSISNKCVYKIEGLEEIKTKFQNLNSSARLLLVVNKNDGSGIDGNMIKYSESKNYCVYEIKN
jgi:putative effector of murein hydrolase LrgA (UPF0299 family)